MRPHYRFKRKSKRAFSIRKALLKKKLSLVEVSEEPTSTTSEKELSPEETWRKLINDSRKENLLSENEDVMDVDESDSDDPDFVLPELIVEKSDEPDHNSISGRRIVDINHLLKQLELLAGHSKRCTMGKYKFSREIVCGLYSKFIYYCDNCESEYVVTSEPTKKKQQINDAVVWGSLSIGIGRSQIQELFAILEVPVMSSKKFMAHEASIGKVWEETLISQMKRNAEEERRLAIEKGNFFNTVPCITVIGDGGWAKRSYGHGLNSASGVGVIIGAETKKLLFLGVRNKFCYTCSKLKTAAVEKPKHDCHLNYRGPSTGMESSVIVEGFKRSEQDYGLIYSYYIGDGDSSVFAKIQEGCRYGRFVKKVECANHMTRALSDNLHKLAANTKFPLESRRILSGTPEGKTITRLERLVKGVRTAIKDAGSSKSAEDVATLRQDIGNAPYHVLGDHSNCRVKYCKLKPRIDENIESSKQQCSGDENLVIKIDDAFFKEILKLVEKMERKAGSLVINATTNCAERYMGLVSKLTGGKRVNFTSHGSYKRRCYAAGLSHTTGPSWHFSPWKRRYGSSPGQIFKKVFRSRGRLNAKRVLRFTSSKQVKRKKTSAGYDREYGPLAVEADVEEEELSLKMNEIVVKLNEEAEKREEIERQTVGQYNNPLWEEKRMNRLTASNFGAVIKRLEHTSCHNLVKKILYKKELNSPAVVFGRTHERVAIKSYEEKSAVSVRECGFFIDEEHCFLGASPDGLVGNDGVVEVKCLPSVQGKIKDAANCKKTNFCLEFNKQGILQLKRKHNYFFQVQGQLNICKRLWCDLIVYTKDDFFVERIKVDRKFWSSIMLPKLIRFFNECILPEIADSRIIRQMKIRDPLYIQDAQKKRDNKKTEQVEATQS